MSTGVTTIDQITEFLSGLNENQVVDRTKVNDVLDNLDKYQNAVGLSLQNTTRQIEEEIARLPSEYDVKADYTDNSNILIWLGNPPIYGGVYQ